MARTYREVTGTELITNGNCATDSFAKGTGWSHDAANEEYDCDGSQVSATDLYQTSIVAIGSIYKIVYTVKNYAAGNIRVRCGSGTNGLNRSADATYTEYLVATGNTSFYLQGDASFAGSIDDVSVKEVIELGSDPLIFDALTASGSYEGLYKISQIMWINDEASGNDIAANDDFQLTDTSGNTILEKRAASAGDDIVLRFPKAITYSGISVAKLDGGVCYIYLE